VIWTHILIWALPLILLVVLIIIWGVPKPNISWKWLVSLVTIVLVGWGIWWFIHRPAKPATPTSTYLAPATPVATATPYDNPEYPRSGSGIATKAEPLKAWLNPKRTCTRARKNPETEKQAGARYIFVEDPTITFDDLPGDNINHGEWLRKPPGKYMVYPIPGVEKIHFRWWQ